MIDLSFPSVMAFSMTAFALTLTATGNGWLAFLLGLIAGLLAGLLNGLIVVKVGIPAQMIWTILIALAFWFFLNRPRRGAHIYLVGDNLDSARLMGINAD